MAEPVRVAIAGAAGRISYALLFRIAAGGMFGASQPVALRLLEVPSALPQLEDTMMELHDCNFPLLSHLSGHTEGAEAFSGADWIILDSNVPHHPESTRAEQLHANGPVFQAHGRAINEAAPSARILTVATPCNTNCLIARSVARDVPAEHWFALMRIHQSRARALLAEKAGTPVDQVHRVTAWGNNSPTVYPDFHNAFIGDRPAAEVIRDADWVREVFEPTVRNRVTQVGASSSFSPAGSAAQSIIATIRSLTTPTPYGQHFSVAVVSDGSYGVPSDLVFGFPLRTEDGKTWSIVQEHYLDDYAQSRIAENVAELEIEASSMTDLLC